MASCWRMLRSVAVADLRSSESSEWRRCGVSFGRTSGMKFEGSGEGA